MKRSNLASALIVLAATCALTILATSTAKTAGQRDPTSASKLTAAAELPTLAISAPIPGFSQPVSITHAGDGSGRIFVVEQEGAVAEDNDLKIAEKNRAFVLMQYFGYLRRNPDDPPNTDLSGYNFWLTKLEAHGGNFVSAEMVRAFLISQKYRSRFGQP